MVTANPHGDLEMFFEAQRQLADEKQARSGYLDPKHGGPIAEGWQLTVGYGHSGFGIYAHLTEYPEEGSIFWRTLNDVQNEAYAEGRKDEREANAKECAAIADGIEREGEGNRDGRYDWMVAGAQQCADALREPGNEGAP